MRYFIEVNIVCQVAKGEFKRSWKKVKPSSIKPYSFETLDIAKNNKELFYPEARYGDGNVRIVDEKEKICK